MISYYILRSDLTSYYVNDIIERLQAGPDQREWDVGGLAPTYISPIKRTILKELEATLHCLTSIQEASPVEDSEDLKRLLSSDVLGMFPKTGSSRARRTTIVLIGEPYLTIDNTGTDDNRFLRVLVHHTTTECYK